MKKIHSKRNWPYMTFLDMEQEVHNAS